MSVEAMAWALNLAEPTLKPTTKLVLIGIANHHGDGGSWPSVATLARYANVSGRRVQQIIGELVEAGVVEVVTQEGGTAQTRPDRRTNLYLLPMLDGAKHTSPRPVNGVKPGAERGEAQRANGVKPISPEPSFNHPREPSTSFPVVASDSEGADAEPTPNQRANTVASGLYDKIKADTGKPPVGWKMPQMVKLLSPFFDAGWSVPEVKRALWAVHTGGFGITRQSIERELDGRARKPRPNPNRPKSATDLLLERVNQP